MRALKESADTFPPLKSAVSGVVALFEIAEVGGCLHLAATPKHADIATRTPQRAKHAKSDAHAIALRTKEILDVVADAVPDGSAIPAPMAQSIQRFTGCVVFGSAPLGFL
jgi:hypothetical protein